MALTEDKINELANVIDGNEGLLNLGTELKFTAADMAMYVAGNVNDRYEGTRNMLHAWQKKTPNSQEEAMRIALGRSNLADVAVEVFGDQTKAIPRYKIDQLANVMKNRKEVGHQLGFNRGEVETYLNGSMHDGTRHMLHAWQKTTTVFQEVKMIAALHDSSNDDTAEIVFGDQKKAIPESKIIELANTIDGIPELPDFGLKLGFLFSKVTTFLTDNVDGKYEGIVNMLHTWQKKTSEYQEVKMIVALHKSHLHGVTYEVFGDQTK